MTTQGVLRRAVSGSGWALIVCLLMALFATSATAQTGGFVQSSPAPSTEHPDVIDSDSQTTPDGSDPQTTPDGSDPQTTPGGSDPQTTPGGSDPGALAPGFVTVVLWTSDGNVASTGGSVCVGSVCQPAGGSPNGAKIEFDDVAPGWQPVSAQNAAPYRDVSTSVLVKEGAGSRVEITLVVAVEQGPREQVEQVPGGDRPGRDVVPPKESPARTFGEANVEQNVIRALPQTGVGASSSTVGLWLALAAASLGLLAVAVRHRGVERG